VIARRSGGNNSKRGGLIVDLNHLYFQHQRALMRAEASADLPERYRHQSAADCLASRIEQYQAAIGAGIAAARSGIER
jgi:hypothetical protein